MADDFDAVRQDDVHQVMLGALDKIGPTETGKLADFVITNADYSQKRVFIGGKEL